jgi:hypothetical protein
VNEGDSNQIVRGIDLPAGPLRLEAWIAEGNSVRISGTIPATCSDFKIDRPSFLTVPIKNEIPVKVEMTWHKM